MGHGQLEDLTPAGRRPRRTGRALPIHHRIESHRAIVGIDGDAGVAATKDGMLTVQSLLHGTAAARHALVTGIARAATEMISAGCCRGRSCCGAAARLPCPAIRPTLDLPPAARHAAPSRASPDRTASCRRRRNFAGGARWALTTERPARGHPEVNVVVGSNPALPGKRKMEAQHRDAIRRRTVKQRPPDRAAPSWSRSGRGRHSCSMLSKGVVGGIRGDEQMICSGMDENCCHTGSMSCCGYGGDPRHDLDTRTVEDRVRAIGSTLRLMAAIMR